MPLPPPPGDLLAQIQKRSHGGRGGGDDDGAAAGNGGFRAGSKPSPAAPAGLAAAPTPTTKAAASPLPEGTPFQFDAAHDAFALDLSPTAPQHIVESNTVVVPLAPCVYRLTDHALAKGERIGRHRCLLKLGVLRCLRRECAALNELLRHRLVGGGGGGGGGAEGGGGDDGGGTTPTPKNWPPLPALERDSKANDNSSNDGRNKNEPTTRVPPAGVLEEEELAQTRFMELLSNCGVVQKVSELILQAFAAAAAAAANLGKNSSNGGGGGGGGGASSSSSSSSSNRVPRVVVAGLDEFLAELEARTPGLRRARDEIQTSETVSFFPGLGELFCPGSPLLCFPEGGVGELGCQVVQCWYAEDENRAQPGKLKRRFVVVVEFVVSVGDALVFVAASDVYPEFVDCNRSVPLKDLAHRRLDAVRDAALLQRLQQRGEFYASVATHNHYLEYHPNSFFPILNSGGNFRRNSAVRPLSKGGRVMVDVQRGILEGHLPVGSGGSDGTSDTVREAIRLWDQSQRTGVAVPFRTCRLPPGLFDASVALSKKERLRHGEPRDSDRAQLWQAWPVLLGFSFTARVWGKLLLSLPKLPSPADSSSLSLSNSAAASARDAHLHSPRRHPAEKLGVQFGGLGGEGACGNCGYIQFHEQAFDQLVLADDKKELIRAVARNAGGGASFHWEEDGEDNGYESADDDDDDDDIALDVVANKGAASIFLLSGPPGTGKTLTAEAISELLKKPLYIVTAGDLGITAAEVEKTLGSVLELCSTWDALVLIDEADIFLEARSSSEIQRNALVCVMLRLLEYYSGCLFLSSNRAADSIDAAIASRITVMLEYPALDAEGRAKVWKNLVELVPLPPKDSATGAAPNRILQNPRKASKYRNEFTAEDFAALATGYELNGRQIKNSIVLARALARERGSLLSVAILQRAVTAVAGKGAVV